MTSGDPSDVEDTFVNYTQDCHALEKTSMNDIFLSKSKVGILLSKPHTSTRID